MAEERVNNRETQRSQSAVVNRGNRIVPPSPIRTSFTRLLDQTKMRMEQLNQSSSGAASVSDGHRPPDFTTPVQNRDRDPNTRQEFANRFRERDRESDSDSKNSRTSEDGRPRAKVAEERVIARHSLSERQNQNSKGKGEGQGGGAGQGKRGKEFAAIFNTKDASKVRLKELSQASFATKLAQAAKQSAAATQSKIPTPRILSKAVIDQIVQYVRLITRPDGEKEIDLTLHGQIFKGLKLRVALVQGKVEATFVTGSEQVQALFNSQKGALQAALAEKGIDVRQIDVIMA